MFPFAGVEIFQDLVSHFQPFQVDDANVFVAVFPDLPLLKFQRHVNFAKTVSPESNRGETIE